MVSSSVLFLGPWQLSTGSLYSSRIGRTKLRLLQWAQSLDLHYFRNGSYFNFDELRSFGLAVLRTFLEKKNIFFRHLSSHATALYLDNEDYYKEGDLNSGRRLWCPLIGNVIYRIACVHWSYSPLWIFLLYVHAHARDLPVLVFFAPDYSALPLRVRQAVLAAR